MSCGIRLTQSYSQSRSRISGDVVQRILIIPLLITLLVSTFLNSAPARASQHLAPAFKVELTKNFFGAQAVDAKLTNPSDPTSGRFIIENHSELWYSVRMYPSSAELKPTVAIPETGLVSEAVLESGLLM